MRRLGDIEFTVEDRIARGIFVHVRGAVADPLARDEDRQFDVQLDLAHLERGRVPVPHQVPDQPGIVAGLFRPGAIADAGGLHDGGVVAHVIDHADQPVVEDRDRLVQARLQPLGHRTAGGGGCGAGGLDLGLLLFGQPRAHRAGLHGVELIKLSTMSCYPIGRVRASLGARDQ